MPTRSSAPTLHFFARTQVLAKLRDICTVEVNKKKQRYNN